MAARTETDDLRAAWRALVGGRGGEGWNTISVARRAPCPLLAGRRSPGDEEALLVGFNNIRSILDSQLPQGKGFEVAKLTGDPTGGDRFWLALTRRTDGSLDLFAMMAEDLIDVLEKGASRDEHGLLNEFLARIHAWQEFMDRHKEGILSPEAEVGLFGELVVIGHIIDAGMLARHVIDAWQGPLDGLQDFVLGSGGIEVKSTLSTGGFPAAISSLEQLDDSLRHPLFLAAVRIRLDISGITLPAMAEAIRKRLGGNRAILDMFELRLMQAGLLSATAEHYTRRFLLVSTAVLAVDDDFPRITRSNTHPAVRRVRYEVDLELTGAPDIGLKHALETLGVR